MGRGPGVRVVGPDAIQLDFRWKRKRIRPRIRLSATKANVLYCRRWKQRIEDEIARNEFVWEKHFPDIENPFPDREGDRLLDLALDYVKTLTGTVEPETATEYEQNAKIVCTGLHNPLVKNLTRAMFRHWVSVQTLSKNRIDNLLRPIRGALAQAVEDGVLDKSPLDGFEVRRITTGQKRKIDPFTPIEINALARAQLGELWVAWVWTGLRSGEIIGLRKGDVDIEAGELHVRRAIRRGREKRPKTESGARTVTLLAPAKKVLAQLVDGEPDEPVFINPNTGRYWHEAKALNRAFARACQKAQVRRRNVYQLRHTYATWALSAGENPAWIANQMGHADTTEVFETYGQWMPDLDPKAGLRMLTAVQPKGK